MLNQIKQLYRYIEQTGITPDLNFSQKLRVELSNLVMICTTPMLLLTFFTEFFQGADPIEIMTNFLWALVIVPPLVFNYFHKYKLSRYWIVLAGTLFTSFLMLLYGSGLQMEPLFLVYLVCGFYFFDGKTSLILSIGIFLTYFLLISFGNLENAPFKHDINSSSNFMALLYSALIIGLLTYKVLSENRNFYKLSLAQKAKLQLKNEELERFAYVAAHDLKTPLRNLYSYLGLIELKYDKSNEQINRYIKSSKKSAEQLHNLIGDILSYSHLESTSAPRQTIDLNELVSEVKENFSNQINQKSVKIRSEKLPVIVGDKVQLKLLFQNLIENGLKYNESSSPEIKIKSHIRPNEIVLKFQDNGIGIEEEYQEQIFKMFTRLHSSDLYKGSGMGLAICKKIVENLYGSIGVSSKKNQGTVFSITLPRLKKVS